MNEQALQNAISGLTELYKIVPNEDWSTKETVRKQLLKMLSDQDILFALRARAEENHVLIQQMMLSKREAEAMEKPETQLNASFLEKFMRIFSAQ